MTAAAFGAGANSANGPNLQLKDNQATLAAARRDAMSKARAEAEAYAAGLGMKIVRVLRVSERGDSASSDIFVSGGRVSHSYAVSAPIAPPLSAGEIRQTVNVWVDYALAAK